jgi:hypothetical protein
VAEKHLEADDPYAFVAARYPAEPGVDAEAVMARCIVEEYALMGVSRQKMMQLFRSRAFAGTHAILASRGEAFVQQIIDEVYGAVPAQEVS